MDTGHAETVAWCIGDADHRILDCDNSYLELLGRERGDVIGRHPLELTYAVDQRVNADMLGRLSTDGTAFAITKRYVRGDSSLVWVSNAVAPVRDGVGPARLSCASRLVVAPTSPPALMRNLFAARRLCAAFVSGKDTFGADLIAAPVVEILLALYLAELEGRSLTDAEIAEAIGIRPSVLLRWLRALHERALIDVEGRDTTGTIYRIGKKCEHALDALLAADPAG